MRETERNIRRYKKQLISTKEKVVTSIMLFVMSAVMLTTASLAWLVLSVSPEVSNITTTIAGNGNLEIALAHTGEEGTLVIPNPSAVGDGLLESLREKNITWGNLINLNDPSYGFEFVELKPAELNDKNQRLDLEPLRVAKYDKDGRVIGYLDNLTYSSYDLSKEEFLISNPVQYGVRAISSWKETGDNKGISKIINELELKKEAIGRQYNTRIQSHRDAISKLMGTYISDRADQMINNTATATSDYRSQLPGLIALFKDFNLSIYDGIVLYDEIAQYYFSVNDETMPYSSLDDLLKMNEANLKANNIKKIPGYIDLILMYQNINDDIASLENVLNDTVNHAKVYFADIDNQIDHLVVVGSAILNPRTDKLVIGKLSMGDYDKLLSILNNESNEGLITEGYLVDYEQIIGYNARLDMTIVSDMSRIGFPYSLVLGKQITVNATVYTSAGSINQYTIKTAFDELTKQLNDGAAIIKVADDVYGLALDFWLRTNVSDSYITLEGEATVDEEVLLHNEYICYVDTAGNKYYHIPNSEYPAPSNPVSPNSIKEGDAIDRNSLMYGDIYYYVSGQIVSYDGTTDEEISNNRKDFVSTLSFATKTVVIGYDGVNRVWQEGVATPESSTTQGNGSYYMFYYSDPVEKEELLSLLNSFTVVFIDEYGKWLANAQLNTLEAFDDNGKVIVPLKLTDECITYDEKYVITSLEQNVATLITAIVYLDGSKVTNLDVEADLNIEGFLNLQFGSTVSLENMDDKDLKTEEIHLTASVTDSGPLDYDKDNLPSTELSISVAGVTPKTVTAKMIRKINASQGVLTDNEIILSDNDGDGVWKAVIEFDKPGNYILRSAFIDGVEYEFDNNQQVEVEVSGFKILGLTGLDSISYIITSDKYSTNTLSLSYSGAYEPNEIKGVFETESGQNVIVNFIKDTNGTLWTGNAVFSNSGTYILRYINVDDITYSLSSDMTKTITLFLDVTADVTMNKQDTQILFEAGKSYDIDVSVKLLDENMQPIEGLNYVTINYASSSIEWLNPELKWNANTKEYEGTFHINKPNRYTFSYIGISQNSTNVSDGLHYIEKAKNAYDIFAIDPTPPYLPTQEDNLEVNVTNSVQFAPNDDGKFSLNVKDSTNATLISAIVNDGTRDYIIPGVYAVENGTQWDFILPSREKKSQNGEWTLKKLYVSNATDMRDGEYYSKSEEEQWIVKNTETETANSFVWDMENYNIKTTIINDIKVLVSYDEKSVEEFNGLVTTALEGNYRNLGYNITITDIDDNSLDKYSDAITVSNPVLTYSLSEQTMPNWWTNKEVMKENKKNPRTTFSKSDSDLTFYYPGTYVPSLSLTINGEVVSISKTSNISYVNLTQMVDNEVVAWTRPDVIFNDIKFSSYNSITVKTSLFIFASVDKQSTVTCNITMGTTFPTKRDSGVSYLTNSNSIVKNGKEGIMYSYAYKAANGRADGVSYSSPEVRLELVNIDASFMDSASVIIKDSNNNNYTQTFNFTNNSLYSDYVRMGAVQNYAALSASSIGIHNNRTSNGSKATYFTFVHDGVSYNFDLNGELVVNYAY